MTNSAFKDLTERVENPTLDQIKEAAEKNNQVVVSTQEYDALMHPDEVAIKTHRPFKFECNAHKRTCKINGRFRKANFGIPS